VNSGARERATRDPIPLGGVLLNVTRPLAGQTTIS
jgi:hypothetical protein